MGVRANPMIANRRARQFCAAKPYSAGTSFRRARSPDAPKMTIVHGSAGVIELCFPGSGISITAPFSGVMSRPSFFSFRFYGMAAKLIAHRSQQLVGIRFTVARGKTLQQ